MSDEITIILPEIMDMLSAEAFLMDVKKAITKDTKNVILDASKVDKINTVNFQLIVSLKKTLEVNDSNIKIINPTKIFTDNAELLGLSKILKLHEVDNV